MSATVPKGWQRMMNTKSLLLPLRCMYLYVLFYVVDPEAVQIDEKPLADCKKCAL